MSERPSLWQRLALPVLVAWPALSLTGWGLAKLLDAPESLLDSAVKVGVIMLGVTAFEAGRRRRAVRHPAPDIRCLRGETGLPSPRYASPLTPISSLDVGNRPEGEEWASDGEQRQTGACQ
ncbi:MULTISPECIES: hypothetical protein [unclassified Streptomyces]|uniref:hypothetical protein n=1 Tax=unclassified Streptomyces TaxID=2593676 RepID=UPI00131A091E|nr:MULTISPECIES: hypothetical protein [unclassified Streptomyces]MYX34830.1 hypothetical protein [Streptomyces sp. SID8377]